MAGPQSRTPAGWAAWAGCDWSGLSRAEFSMENFILKDIFQCL